MNSIVEKRKQNWVDFYDITSPVNRWIIPKTFRKGRRYGGKCRRNGKNGRIKDT